MIRLPKPEHPYEDVIDICIEGIVKDVGLKRKLINEKGGLLEAGQQYEYLAKQGILYLIEPTRRGYLDACAVGNLTGAELNTIYTDFFSKKPKPARSIYEDLMSAANEQCPFCGMGEPNSLDHFLPKGRFPQFSIFPSNLVPSCTKCNTDNKKSRFAGNMDEQIIHPYLDHARFFNAQWLYADFIPPGVGRRWPGRIDYYVAPPKEWSEPDKVKVENHFRDFKLAYRFGIKAAQELELVLTQMLMTRSFEYGCETILAPGVNSAPSANHWRRAMYQALLAHFVWFPCYVEWGDAIDIPTRLQTVPRLSGAKKLI